MKSMAKINRNIILLLFMGTVLVGCSATGKSGNSKKNCGGCSMNKGFVGY
jgi:hypothetical protein